MKINECYNRDLNKKNGQLENYIKVLVKKEFKSISINITDVEAETKKYWKELILEYVSELLKKIDTRKTKGSEFSKIKDDLKKTRDDLHYDNPDIETLRSYYEENLSSYREQIKEKIDIEKYNNKQFWSGITIGFILGFVASLLGGYLLTLFIK